ncbi:hypothetical protein V5E97_00195 [Singulisphaera sp. Ch08]|uniref:Endonuclease/exonuclease/phosphatase domain-containing protein n=1 Tax=Singulisphaera sp. Ch08 TaxID=3120278 RepID=A0AAU7CHF5_9BACT
MTDDPSLQAESKPSVRRVEWGFASFAILWSLWLVGQVARDRFWLTGLCFYIPSPVMAAVGLVAASVLGYRKNGRISTLLGLMTLAPTLMVGFVENHWSRPLAEASAGPSVRLVHWNIAYGVWGLAGVEQELVRRRATIYVLSEVPLPYDLTKLAARLGPYHVAVRMGSMAVIATGQLLDPTELVNEKNLKVNSVTWEDGGQPLKIFAVDATSNLLVARDPHLRRLVSLMKQHHPDLVAGDFNAPRRSRSLCPLPDGFAHAYDVAGQGWSATWPVVGPLYAIDQCLISASILPTKYELWSNRFSDHRLQELDFIPRSATERESR